MADTKYPTIRYRTLDKCFRNKYKRFYIDDLIDACSDAIYQHCGKMICCSRRTILNDIEFMESEAGWSIPLVRHRDGKKKWFRYEDTDFTINETYLSEEEYDKLTEMLRILERFRGLSCFEWMDELLFKLHSGLRKSSAVILDFQQAPSLKGMEHMDKLFNSILYKQTLRVTYTSYSGKTNEWIIHPYLIKQYNNRWFLFGRNTSQRGIISNLPIDRIDKIEDCSEKYIENDGSLQNMLDTIIGVSVEKDASLEDVQLKFSEGRFPYIITKPLHHSQKVISNEERIVQISVYPNKELESVILQFGNDVEVLSPASLRKRISDKIQDMIKKY